MSRLSRVYSAALIAVSLMTITSGANDDYFVYVGSYTDAPSKAKGICAWRFMPSTAATTALGLVAETINPAYVVATPDSRFLYATSWQTPVAARGDTVSAYAMDGKTGALKFLNKASTGGRFLNQVIVDPRRKIAVVTNYFAT